MSAFMLIALSLMVPGAASVARALALNAAIPAPTNVCPTSTSDGFTVEWDAPLDPAITGFVVEYAPAAGGTPTTVSVGAVTSKHIVASAGVKYHVTVASIRNGAQSNWGTGCLVQWGAGPGVSLPERVPVGGLANRAVKLLSVGSFGTCAVAVGGAVVCWDGSGTPARLATGALAGQAATKVSVGSGHACAVTSTKHLVCWGANEHGQLGNGTLVASAVPVAATVGGLAAATVLDVAVTAHATCVLTGAQQIRCWGQLAGRSITTPTTITGGALVDHTANSFVAGDETMCVTALWSRPVVSEMSSRKPMQLVCFGRNSDGQIALGGSGSYVTPVAVTRGSLFRTSVDGAALDGGHGCALHEAGVSCWGAGDSHSNGQVGTAPSVPAMLAAKGAFAEAIDGLATGDRFTCMKRVDGAVYCWGDGAYTDGTAGRSSSVPTLLDRGALMGGGVDLLAGGDDTVVGRWDGMVVSRAKPSRPHLVSIVNTVGTDLEVSWTAPSSMGAAVAVTTRVEWSADGVAWSVGATGATSSPATITLPAASYAFVRARSASAFGASDWDVLAAPMNGTGAAGVRFTFATALAQPLVGATVSVRPNGSATSITRTTGATGAFNIDALPLGHARLTVTGGAVAGSVTVASAVFDVYVPSAPVVSGRVPVAITLPPVPAVDTRTITVIARSGDPVPNVGLEYNGALVATMSVDSGVAGAARSVTWRGIGSSFPKTTTAAGVAKVKGLVSPRGLLGLRFDDSRVHVRYFTAFSHDMKVMLPGVASAQITLPDPLYPAGTVGIPVVVRIDNGASNGLAGVPVSLVNAAGVTSVSRTGCTSKTSGVTGSLGSVTFRLCPNGSAVWRVVAPAAVPTKSFSVDEFAAVSQISAGSRHTCARLVDSTVSCTGDNEFGQSGGRLGTLTLFAPEWVPGLSGVESVAAGGDFTCALLSPGPSGTVKCWGRGSAGRLGDGTTATRAAPKFVTGAGSTPLRGVSSIATGDASACAVVAAGANGTVRCWGANTAGQLGDGTTTNRSRPVTVMVNGATPLRGAVQVTVAENHACALLVTGSVRCWGANQVGQLGNGTTSGSRYAVGVVGLGGVVSVSGGGASTCALLSSHTVRCWGSNTNHSLGAGPAYVAVAYTTPLVVVTSSSAVLAGVTQIDAGSGHTCGIVGAASAARLWCWGGNSNGQIGDGTQYSKPGAVPVASSAVRGLRAVSAGGHTMALVPSATRSPYVVYGWGAFAWGALGSGDNATARVPLFIGRF